MGPLRSHWNSLELEKHDFGLCSPQKNSILFLHFSTWISFNFLYGVFELPLLKNAQKHDKQSSEKFAGRKN
jgi:hypothetical protein